MVVVVEAARAQGLTVEHDERTYAFCSARCVRLFSKDPVTWAAKVDAAPVLVSAGSDAPQIDEGLRRWYASCRCCMHDALPEMVATLAVERKAAREPVAGPGICEVAEGKTAP